MEAACVRHTDIPGTAKLFSDILYHFDRVSGFYPAFPLDFDATLKAARKIDFPDERRAAISDALEALNGPSPLIDQLRRPGTVAVVTGQQVGLYGGPCYTIFKALSAVRIARELTAAGQPAVPVFWIATEDHDFAEIDHTWVFDSRQHPTKLSAEGNPLPQQPVGDVSLTKVPNDRLHGALEGFPFAQDVIQMVEAAYQPGRSFGEAFRILVRSILGDHQVLFLDPMEDAVRHIAAPFLREAALKSSSLAASVIRRSKELIDAGYHAQVHFEGKDASLFFEIRDGKRVSLKNRNPAELADRAESLSPNALLRPVMQDYLLPTAVMVGGPAEIAYLAQSAVLYEELLGRQPVAVPRSAFTLLDARASKLMDRYRLTLPEVLDDEESFREKVAARLVPPTVHREFEMAAKQTGAALDRLSAALNHFDPTLTAALTKSRAKITYQLEKTSRKIARETLRRREQEKENVAYLANAIYPHRHLQERFYSILPFLAQHGPDLIERIYENIHLNCPDHRVLPV